MTAPQTVADVLDKLTLNQRLVLTGREWDIDSRRSRTRARNDLRALRLLYSEGDGRTPFGQEVAKLADSRAAATSARQGETK